MATHDYNIANQTATNARTDINNALLAIVSNNSSDSEPSTKFKYMWWYDTSTHTLKLRNEGNDDWIIIGQLDQTNNAFSGGTPAGAVQPFAMSTPPTGWLKCNGQAVSRTGYAALFSAIGTTYGTGDGSTTFNVPDLRGEFIRGWDDSRGIDSGRTLGSNQSDAIEAHTHDVDIEASDIADSATELTSGQTGLQYHTYVYDPEGQPSAYLWSDSATGETDSTGGTETRPRNIALNYCIKY
jgi:microcystin-dependent protein